MLLICASEMLPVAAKKCCVCVPYEKLQGLVHQAQSTGKSQGPRRNTKALHTNSELRTEMKALRDACYQRARAKAAAARINRP